MTPFGLRRRIKHALGLGEAPSDTSPPRWQSRPPGYSTRPSVEPPAAEPAPEPAPEPAAEPAPEPVAEPAPAAPEASGSLTLEAVQQVLDEMVRPALQGDGGDISLVAVEGDDVHVRLVGACSTCPSSIMTMKMGVEALLREEFPMMRELVQVS